jgi:hypothetical protein
MKRVSWKLVPRGLFRAAVASGVVPVLGAVGGSALEVACGASVASTCFCDDAGDGRGCCEPVPLDAGDGGKKDGGKK